MLTKRSHIVTVLILALAFPAAALAASGAGSGSADSGGAAIGVADAIPAPAAGPEAEIALLQQPIDRFQHLVRAGARRIRASEWAELRRERREAFATLPAGVSLDTLEAIASCESGGDPTAVSSDGSYRGKYQFDYGTWESVGGKGDPAAASEPEQNYRAALLYSQAGSSPWPICG